MFKFKFTDIGEGLHEGKIGEIYVQLNQSVKEGDALYSVETAKMVSDITSPVDGVITQILVTPGQDVHVGDELFYIDDSKGGKKAAPDAVAAKPEVKPEPKPVAATEASSAGVVGQIKASSELFDINNIFGTSSEPAKVESTTSTEAPPPKAVAPTVPVISEPVNATFDLIVIGAGPGGYLAAEHASKSGLKVLLVEKEYWGGVCLNVGCIPTKTLLHGAEELKQYLDSGNYVVTNQKNLVIDYQASWSKIQAHKEAVIKKLSTGVQLLMKSLKVTTITGEAKFVSSHHIKVNDEVYQATKIIVATGATDRRLPLPGFEAGYQSQFVVSSDQLLSLATLPKHLVIIGAGVIGIEFAQLFAAYQTQVTVLETASELLANTPLTPEVKQEITKHLQASGVKFIFNAAVSAVEEKQLIYQLNGETHKLKADKILVAIGRQPNVLNVESVGIKLSERRGIDVNEQMLTSVPNIYAIGDVTNRSQLAHVAYAHALKVIDHLLGHNSHKPHQVIPGGIYTTPEIGFAGLTLQQATQAGHDAFSVKVGFGTLGKSIATNKTKGFVQLVVDKKYGAILGCFIIGPNATDYISEVVLAIDYEISVFDLAITIHPHPTYGEIVWEAAKQAVLKLEALKK